FKTAADEVLAISIPRTECAVIRHFQERMPYGLFVNANCFHPGLVATGFNRNNGLQMDLGMTILSYHGKSGPGSGELCQPTRPPVLVTTSSATWVGGKA